MNRAERIVFFKAVSEGEKTFMHLVIAGYAPDPISPCDACRQAMVEFYSPDMSVTLIGGDGVTKATTVHALLLYAFTKEGL